MKKKIKPVLTPDSGSLYENEYTMRRGAQHSCWITVGKLSIHIFRKYGGSVKVSAFPLKKEMDEPLGTFTIKNRKAKHHE